MKSGLSQDMRVPSDQDIERDEAELRRLLADVEGPSEPHPAYYQNFLVHLHRRIDDEQPFRRRRWVPSLAWTSLSAATLAVILVISGVLPSSAPQADPRQAVQEHVDRGSTRATPDGVGEDVSALLYGDDGPLALHSSDPSVFESNTSTIVLTSDEVRMIDAIHSDDESAMFEAMVDSDI